MAFTNRGTLAPWGAPVLLSNIVANSITITINDSVKAASGFIALGTAGALVWGHVVGLGTEKGLGLNTTGATGAEIGSFINTYTTASDNQTVGKIKALCDVSKFTQWSAELSAAIGTTTGSNLIGYRMDLTDEDTLDESTAATTSAQYATFGVDPQLSTQAIVNIYESQVFGL
jgi:hypothetical protein